MTARLRPRPRLLVLALAAVVAMVWAPSALGQAAAVATDPTTAQPATTADGASSGATTDPGTTAPAPVTDPSPTTPSSSGEATATPAGGDGQTANEHTPITGATTGGGTTASTPTTGGGATTPPDTGATTPATGTTTPAATGTTTSATGTSSTADDAAAATTLPVKPDVPPAAADRVARVDAPDPAPAAPAPAAARPDPVAATIQHAPAFATRADVPDMPVRAAAPGARRSPPGGPDARPATRATHREVPAGDTLRLAPLAREAVVHASASASAAAATPGDPAPDPVARRIAPRLGADSHAPRASAVGVDAFAPLPPVSGQTTAAGGLLQILVGYFAPPGGSGTHMILLAELALFGAALGLGMFRSPLLRFVLPDGRRRAGYQAVALRPG